MSLPRSVALERIAYTLAAPVLAAAPNIAPAGSVDTVILLAGGAGVVGSLYAIRGDNGAGRRLVRLAPLTLAAAVDITARSTPGWGWDALLAAGWAAAGCLVLPLSRGARRKVRRAITAPAPVPQLTPTPQPVAADGADALTRGVRQLWERAGSPGRTLVVSAHRHAGMPHDLTMLLRACEPGRAITNLREADVAAAFGIAEGDITLARVTQQPGRQGGPGWLEVSITPDEALRRRTRPTDHEWWADTIGTKGIPGSVFVRKVRNEARGVTYWTAHLPDGVPEPRIDQVALCQALKVSSEDGRAFVTTAGSDILVSVWDSSPLVRVYPATRELLTPDAEGRWVAGYLTTGQPARNRVYTDRGAAHGLLVAPTGGGKTQLMALFVCADANFGAVVWLASQAADEKTTALGEFVDRQGSGELYMVRAMRAALALMEIRAKMPWADGRLHDWDPKLPGCPYSPLSVYWDEFLTAAREGTYGPEIMDNAEELSVKGRKYAIGEKVAGQSVYVQDGFTQLLNENLRELCIPIVLKVAPKKVADMFKALGVAPENVPAPLPRSFSKAEDGRIDRIMRGEPEPPNNSNTGGVGWIVDGSKPEVMRSLYMDFSKPIDHLFPETITRLTDHEITELTKRGLWFDWQNEPPRPGEFGPDSDEPRKPRGAGKSGGRHDAITSPRQALDAIKNLTGA
ncbi:chromosome segregation protein ParM [Kitasatospora sp. RG8]|uniref:chromosome segregation protein ParM n=1 Tax=Kitasatospora sp. RG8 TaxID=2820815 RepID=UPI001AE031C0|nr:chromosome segregation protein ParM [Kitasatospora sp. RG8]MBP0453985.1 chromosome segregation protein ParM [Kitasatospora sp. RG8]